MLIFLILAMIFLVYIPTYTRNEINSCTDIDIKNIKDMVFATCYFQRLLMIEILHNKRIIKPKKPETPEIDISDPDILESQFKESSKNDAEEITVDRILNNIETLRKLLIRPFGGSAAQKISTFLIEKNTIIRKFYHSIQMLSLNSENVDVTETLNNMATATQKTLDKISHQICDQMGINLSDQKIDYDKKVPVINNKKFYNILSMYDSELLNQAKTYATKNYVTSLNHSQSLLEISYHLSNQLSSLIKNNSQNTEILL